MKLIGMLDSPYVRRVAVTLRRMEVEFEHEPLSVFPDMQRFSAINPLIKAPTFIIDDGQVLMESSLILDYVEFLKGPGNGLLPSSRLARAQTLRVIGLALVAYEKAVQIYYERNLRPVEIQHAPWIERVSGQLKAACSELEHELAQRSVSAGVDIGQDGISIAVGWSFIQLAVPDQVSADEFPLLARFCAQAEELEIFKDFPMV